MTGSGSTVSVGREALTPAVPLEAGHPVRGPTASGSDLQRHVALCVYPNRRTQRLRLLKYFGIFDVRGPPLAQLNSSAEDEGPSFKIADFYANFSAANARVRPILQQARSSRCPQ